MGKHKPSVRLPFDDAVLIEIGRIVTLWAYFEVEFDGVLHGLLLHPKAAKLTAIYPRRFNVRLKLYKDAVDICFGHHKETHDRFMAIAERAATERDKRDFVAHGRWSFPSPGRKASPKSNSRLEVSKIQDGDWGRRKGKFITLQSLQSTSKAIGELAAEFHVLTSPFGHWSVSSAITRDLQVFRQNNFPPLAQPQIPSLHPRPLRK